MVKNIKLKIESFLIKKIFKKKIPKNYKNLKILKLESMDYLGIFKIIVSAESTFKIKFTDKEIFSKKFENLIGILNLINKKISDREKK